MIAKKIPNPKKSSSKAARAGGLVDYIHEPTLENDQEKCIHFEAVNFMTDTLEAQKMEMIALSLEGTRSKDPIDHWVLSFRADEHPTKEQARDAVAIFVRHCGLDGHQYVYGLHDDTQNKHIHIAVNRVHPETLQVIKINKGFDREAAQQAIALIEHAQGWQKEAGARYDIDQDGLPVRWHLAPQKPLGVSARAKTMELHTGEKSLERVVKEVAGPIIKGATSWRELHDRLGAVGIQFEREGSGAKVYVGTAPVGIKASTIDHKASFAQLQKRLGAYQPSKEIKPNEYHHHTQEQNVAAPGTGTTDRLRRLSECYLAVLAPERQGERARVLQIDARADRRGADGLRRQTGRGGVDLAAPQPLANGQTGWNEYLQIRDEQRRAKAADWLDVRARQDKERKALAAVLSAERLAHLKGDWTGKGELRNAIQSILATKQAVQKIELAERHRAEKDALRARYKPLPMYRQWKDQPQIVSMEVLPEHVQRAQRDLQPETLSTTLKELEHVIDQRGHVTYRLSGKDVFRDEGRCIAVLDTKGELSIAAALATAQAKFGNTLTLTGSDAFQKSAVAAAVANNLTCRFSDPGLNTLRDDLVVQKQKREQEARERSRLAAQREAALEMQLAAERAKEQAAAKKPEPEPQPKRRPTSSRGNEPGM